MNTSHAVWVGLTWLGLVAMSVWSFAQGPPPPSESTTAQKPSSVSAKEQPAPAGASGADRRETPPGSLAEKVRAQEPARPEEEPAAYPIQMHHQGSVCTVAFSPDSQLLASGSTDQTFRLWSVASGRELRRLEGHTCCVVSVSFSPSERTVASGSKDHSIHLWDLDTGRIRRRMLHDDIVYAVDYAPDGKTLVSGSADETVRLWDAATGKELRRWTAHPGGVRSVAFAPDGSTVASAGEDHLVRLWRPTDGAEVASFAGHRDRVDSVVFSPDGSVLASGSKDRNIRFWDVGRGVLLRSFTADNIGVRSLEFSPNGQLLASGGYDGKVRIWDSLTSLLVGQSVPHQRQPVHAVAFSADGRLLASGGEDRSILMQDDFRDTPREEVGALNGRGPEKNGRDTNGHPNGPAEPPAHANVRDAVNDNLNDVASALRSLNQSFLTTPIIGAGAASGGGYFIETQRDPRLHARGDRHLHGSAAPRGDGNRTVHVSGIHVKNGPRTAPTTPALRARCGPRYAFDRSRGGEYYAPDWLFSGTIKVKSPEREQVGEPDQVAREAEERRLRSGVRTAGARDRR